MQDKDHSRAFIPWLDKISDFYDTFKIGKAENNSFTIMRMEEQAKGKLLFMPLFRGNFFRLIICKTPGIRFLLPDETVSTSANSIYFAYPGKIESWQRVETIYGYLICFTPEFAGMDLHEPVFEKDFPFMMNGANSILQLSQKDMDAVGLTAEALLSEMKSGNADYFEMIKPLLMILLIQIRRLYVKDKEAKTDFQLKQASLTGYFFYKNYGLNELQIGIALLGYGIPGLLLGPLLGRAADRYGRSKIIPLGLFVGTAAVMLLSQNFSLAASCVLVALLSLGFDLSHPLFAAVVTTFSSKKGAATGLFAFFLFSGYGLGSLVLSLIVNIGLQPAFQLFGIGMGIAAAFSVFVFRKEK